MGVFLHTVLETLDFPQAEGAALDDVLRSLLLRYQPLALQTEEEEADTLGRLRTLIARTLDTPMDEDPTLCLRALTRGDRLDEMEFHFPVEPLSPVQPAISAVHAGTASLSAPTRGGL